MRPSRESVFLFFFVLGMAWAQEEVTPASIPAHKLTKPPVIDGVVQPGEWAEALKITEFWSPLRQKPGEFPTTAYLGYDARYFYVAFECEDPEPSKIRAQETKRGGSVEKDDLVAVLVDPQNKRLEPYWFEVNPLGTQIETIPGGSTENIRWRGDWEAKARLHEKGWCAEMRVPFAILRYPNGQTRFGLALVRSIPRLDELYAFPRMGNFFDERKHTEWTGLELPPQRRLPILLPYTMVDVNSASRENRSGLDLKYVTEGGLTSLFTLRPDFRNIAADIARINFSYAEKVLAETRPFFQEGGGFLPDNSVFYSVRVEEVNSALKSFGNVGNWQYGLLGGEQGSRRFAVGRLRYQVAPRSFLGMVGTFTRWGDANEHLLGFEGEWSRVSGVGEWRLEANLYRFRGEADGHYGRVMLRNRVSERRLGWTLGYSDLHPDYAPLLAFVPERGYRSFQSALSYFDRPAHGPLLNWGWHLFGTSRRLYGGNLLDEGISWTGWIQFRSYRELFLNLNYLRRPPNLDRTVTIGVEWNILDLYRKGGASLLIGEQNGGRSVYGRLEQTLSLQSRLRLGVSAEQFQIDYPESAGLPDVRLAQLIITLNYEISPERVLAGRFVGQGERWSHFGLINNFYLAYWQRVRRGMDLFIIWGLPNASRSQNRLAVKLQMPLEVGG